MSKTYQQKFQHFVVIKFDKSNDTNDVQEANMLAKIVTLEVSIFDKFMDFKEKHFSNIFVIVST